MLPNYVVIIAAVIRIGWSVLTLPYFGLYVGQPVRSYRSLTLREYLFLCFLGIINLIICGRIFGWW